MTRPYPLDQDEFLDSLPRWATPSRVAIMCAVAFACYVAFVLWMCSPASAQTFPYSEWRHNYGLEYGVVATRYGHSRRTHVYRSRRHYDDSDWRDRGERAADRERLRLYREEVSTPEYEFRANKQGPGWKCERTVRGLGTQWIGIEGATQAAWKDWMERVRYDLGEKWLDQTHSENIERRCGRTSIGETAGQVLYRCEIVANPCTAEYEALQTPDSPTAPVAPKQ